MLKMLHAKNGSKAADMDTGNVGKHVWRTARGCKTERKDPVLCLNWGRHKEFNVSQKTA